MKNAARSSPLEDADGLSAFDHDPDKEAEAGDHGCVACDAAEREDGVLPVGIDRSTVVGGQVARKTLVPQLARGARAAIQASLPDGRPMEEAFQKMKHSGVIEIWGGFFKMNPAPCGD